MPASVNSACRVGSPGGAVALLSQDSARSMLAGSPSRIYARSRSNGFAPTPGTELNTAFRSNGPTRVERSLRHRSTSMTGAQITGLRRMRIARPRERPASTAETSSVSCAWIGAQDGRPFGGGSCAMRTIPGRGAACGCAAKGRTTTVATRTDAAQSNARRLIAGAFKSRSASTLASYRLTPHPSAFPAAISSDTCRRPFTRFVRCIPGNTHQG